MAADTFETEIQAILRAKCCTCHNSSSHTSGFSIASQEAVLARGAGHGVAVSAGKPQESVLIRILKGYIKPQMPLGKSLSAEEIGEDLRLDIRANAGADQVRPEALLGVHETRKTCRI